MIWAGTLILDFPFGLYLKRLRACKQPILASFHSTHSWHVLNLMFFSSVARFGRLSLLLVTVVQVLF